MIVEVTQENISRALHFCSVAQAMKSVRQELGQVKNNKRATSRSDFDVFYEGKLAEFAVGQLFGVPVSTDLTVKGDGGIDLVIRGRSVQVKCTRKTPPVLIFNHMGEFKADLAILCVPVTQCTFDVVSFCSRARFVQAHHKPDNWDRLLLDADKMRPIEELEDRLREPA